MGIGLAAGPVAYIAVPALAGVVGSLALTYAGKKLASTIYDKKLQDKCPFC